MKKNESVTYALTGLLVELAKSDTKIEALVRKTQAGIMGGSMYAPSGTEQKTEANEALSAALEEANKLSQISA